jgi:PAS domain S-box-containing protein
MLLGGLGISSLVAAFSVVFMGRDREMVRLVGELSNTHNKLMLIMSSAAEAIYGVDREGRCTFVNAACLRMLGYEREEELIGQDMRSLVYDPDWDGVGDPLEDCCIGNANLPDQGVHENDTLLWRRDGSSFPVERWAHPIRSEEKRVIGAVVTFVDISERKRAEERLRSAQKIEALAQMTGGVAHEFNNLFMAVSGNLELIRDEIAPGSAVEENIDALVRIVLRGGELTQSMLSYVGRQPLVRATVEIEEAIGQSLKILRPMLGKGYDLEFEPRGDIWPVMTDARGLQTALMNLATNARDAMPGGGTITIETRNVRREESSGEERPSDIAAGDYVQVSLIDQGEGMSPGVRQRALDPFFTTKEVGKGTGLGLSMVYGVAKQLGGYVDIDSEPGMGTRVSLFLPRADDGKAEARERGEPEAARGGERQDVVALVVEDEPVVLDVVIGFLKKEGFTVHQAENGDEAMGVVRELGRIDLLVTDIVMPGSANGVTLANWVSKENPSSQIIFMTGYTDSAIEEMGISLENTNVLRKPFTKDKLLRAVGKVLPYFTLADR